MLKLCISDELPVPERVAVAANRVTQLAGDTADFYFYLIKVVGVVSFQPLFYHQQLVSVQ